MGLPATRAELNGFFERRYGGVVFTLIRKRRAERSERAGVLGIDLSCFLQNRLRLGPFAATQIQDAVQIQNVGVSRSEAYCFAEELLCFLKIVRLQGLQSFIEDFLGLRCEHRPPA